MKKIIILYTGGTIHMSSSATGHQPNTGFDHAIRSKLPNHLMENLQLTIEEFANPIDSSNISPSHWNQMGRWLITHYNQYDGFVIVHGTDTMAYTGSMLSFLMLNTQKPIIMTGAQIPMYANDSDGVANMIGALQAACSTELKEVAIFFNNKLLRANRCQKRHTHLVDGFWSPNYPLLGWMNTHGQLEFNYQYLYQPLKNSEKFLAQCLSKIDILCITWLPGLELQQLETLLQLDYHAYIIRTFGAGNLPNNPHIHKLLKHNDTNGKIIINLSQCLQGTTNTKLYHTGLTFEKTGAISAMDMTLETTFCKLHYLMSIYNDKTTIIKKLQTNICGEISLN